MNNSIKRAQSQARLSFAERENFRPKVRQYKKLIMTLALLLTAVTGAWAADGVIMKELTVPSEWNNDATNLTVDEMTGFKDCSSLTDDEAKALLNSVPTGKVLIIYGAGASSNSFKTVINDGTTVDVTETTLPHGNLFLFKDEYKSYYTASDAIEVNPVAEPAANTQQWTFKMPGSNVVLTPIYAKTAAFATTGTEPDVKTLLPEAAEGVIAGTDAPLIVEGTGIVAFAGTSTEVTQGTVMYAVTAATATEAPAIGSSDWKTTVPTAKDIADDGAEVKVWYYIQGADAPQGEAATLDNTFNNSDICATPLTVTVLSNKFDLTLNPANVNTIDATDASKGTVTVGGTDKTKDITDGKLKAVKMDSEVKLKANNGYKFRKVEVKKGAALKTLTVTGAATKSIYYAEGDTWQQAIERPENKDSDWSVLGDYIYNGELTLYIKNSSSVRPGDTINATKNYALVDDN